MDAETLEFSRQLRRNQTETEKKMWYALRGRRFLGLKFRRQHQVGPYLVDLCCPSKRLVVELDGGQHASEKDYDRRRTEYLNSMGYSVLRFWDPEVLRNLEGVLTAIRQHVEKGFPLSPHPSPLPAERGEGNSGPAAAPKAPPTPTTSSPRGRGERAG